MPGTAGGQARKPHPAFGWAVGISSTLAFAALALGWPILVFVASAGAAALGLIGLRASTAAGLLQPNIAPLDAPLDPRVVQILDALPSPTVLVDRRAIVTHVNHAAIKAFPGFRLGFPFSTAIRSPEVLAALDRVLSGKEILAGKARGEADAVLIEHVPVERSFSLAIRKLEPSADSAGRPEGKAFAAIHMAETTQARLVEAMRVDFVANASHELRTPLASILGFVETLQGPARDDAQARAHFLDIMKTQAQRMARLIEDLLSLSRIEMQAHVRPAGTANLRLILPQLKDALSGLARERDVEIRLDMRDGIGDQIPGDPDELMRAIENLIENAIKYGQSGRFVDVALALANEDMLDEIEASAPRDIKLVIRDYGPGIAAEHLPRLTERFFRADVQESRILGGTGLGLAIVKHIVMRHRGRLTIDSVLGEGAIFTIRLPSE